MSVGEAVANDALCKAQKVITCAVRGEAVANDALCKAQKVITWALRG